MCRGFLILVALVAVAPAAASAADPVPGFGREELDLHGFHLLDFGTADYDGDGDLDLFTSNHLDRQDLLANDGSGGFDERLFEAGLGQTRQFPGWEDDEDATVGPPGLYVQARSGLLLRHVDDDPTRGTAAFLFRPRPKLTGPGRVSVRKDRSGPGKRRFVATFRLEETSRLLLDVPNAAHPFRVHISQPFPLQSVYVGPRELNPSDRAFQLYLRDRHGMAWADVTGDSATDAWIVRGGLRNRIQRVAGAIRDELLRGGGASFRPAPAGRSIRKGACRGRMAGAADLAGGARLDLFTTCKAGAPVVYEAGPAGRFERDSALLAPLDTEFLRFADLGGDARPELLAILDRKFAVYEERPGGWERVQSIAGRHGPRKATQIAAADADNDGDQDFYVASPRGSTMLRNNGGRLDAQAPGRFGLPPRAMCAAWADYDNDGDQDLVSIPAGLSENGGGFEFSAAGELETVDNPVEARIAWPDLDGDGSRDAVIASRPSSSERQWSAHAFPNAAAAGHWLELDLRGKSQNRQAIGARIRVRAGGETQTAWVGQNETSVYSLGHYRTYFGLGEATTARVEVRWPDGRTHDLGPVAADQLLGVSE